MDLHQQWLAKRHKLFKLTKNRYKFNKGDSRVQVSRHCSLCGRPLVTQKYGKYQAIKDYYLLKSLFPVYLCCDSHNCYNYYRKRVKKEED